MFYFWPMYQAKINGKYFEIVKNENGFTVGGHSFQWDLSKISTNHFHILHDNKSYRAELVKIDRATKTVQLKINNQTLSVEVKDKMDLLLEKMGMANAAGTKINSLKAPMPGLVIDLKIKAGDAVKTGDPLLILEAMKMENILKSTADAVVKNVKIKKGDSVEKGQVLIEF